MPLPYSMVDSVSHRVARWSKIPEGATVSEHAAGWFNDPYGRFQQRYWSGSAWTEHVATNGVQQVDPMGASSVIPFVTPATAYQAPDSTQPFTAPPQAFAAAADPSDPNAQAAPPVSIKDKATGFLHGLGDDARLRPRPSLRVAVSGLGGAVLAVGVLAAVGGDDPTRGKLVVVGLLLIGAAWALRTYVTIPEVQSAAVGKVTIGIPVFAAAATVGNGEGGPLTAFVTAVRFIAAWALPGFKSRNLLLGLGALFLVATLGAALDDSDGGGFLPSFLTDSVGSSGAVYLLGAAILLGLTWWLDSHAFHGTGTALVSAGLVAAVIGTGLLANEFGDAGGPMFVAIVGFLICAVGTHGNRRATTWWGAVLAAIGVVSFVVVQWEPSSTGAIGSALVVSLLLLVAIPFAVNPLRAAMAKSNQPPAAPPTIPSPFDPPAG